jgi:hypothetical protein
VHAVFRKARGGHPNALYMNAEISREDATYNMMGWINTEKGKTLFEKTN